jgi:hypothetical protein
MEWGAWISDTLVHNLVYSCRIATYLGHFFQCIIASGTFSSRLLFASVFVIMISLIQPMLSSLSRGVEDNAPTQVICSNDS